MGSFHTSCIVQDLIERDRMVAIPKILVDMGSEHTWIPDTCQNDTGLIEVRRLA